MLILLQIAAYSLVFAVLAVGLGWPFAASLPLRPVEKFLASVTIALVAMWLAGWLVFTTEISWNALWLLPVAAVAGLAGRASELAATLRDADVRAVATGQLLVTISCVGWLALVASYSGGGWSADWFEHWERARFFLERRDLDSLLLGHYSLTARPPLVNVVTAVCLALTSDEFWSYQLFTTLFASLTFLPAALIVLRWAPDRRAVALLAVLLLVNPMFLQNATFSWSKLQSAVFVLIALYFFLATAVKCHPIGDTSHGAALRASSHQRARAILFSLALAAALLAHYSAGPYALLLAVAWFARARRWGLREFAATTAVAAGAGLLLLATWFAWSIAHYGISGTAMTNTSITTAVPSVGGQVARIAHNLRDTLVPHFLRSPDPELLQQTSAWGYARDFVFQGYQLNLLLAFGCIAWAVIVRQLATLQRSASRGQRWFWWWFAAGSVLLGIAAHGARDEWGLAHICLQPLVMLGLAVLAARWESLSTTWRRVAIAGATVDMVAGVLLHFSVQNFALDRWLTPNRPGTDVIQSYNAVAQGNVNALGAHRLTTLNAAVDPPAFLVLALLGVILILAIRRTRLHEQS